MLPKTCPYFETEQKGNVNWKCNHARLLPVVLFCCLPVLGQLCKNAQCSDLFGRDFRNRVPMTRLQIGDRGRVARWSAFADCGAFVLFECHHRSYSAVSEKRASFVAVRIVIITNVDRLVRLELSKTKSNHRHFFLSVIEFGMFAAIVIFVEAKFLPYIALSCVSL